MLPLLISFSVLVTLTVATWDPSNNCYAADSPVDVPACTNACLHGAMLEGICGANLGGFCVAGNGILRFLERFGACLLDGCGGDEDRYGIVEAIKEACRAADKEITREDLEGEFVRYFERGERETSDVRTSTSTSTSTRKVETERVSSVLTSQTYISSRSITLATETASPTSTYTHFGSASASPTLPPHSARTTSSLPSVALVSTYPKGPSSTPIATPLHSDSPDSSHPLGAGQIAGIATGVLVFVVIALAASFYVGLTAKRRPPWREHRPKVDSMSRTSAKGPSEEHELDAVEPRRREPPEGLAELDGGTMLAEQSA